MEELMAYLHNYFDKPNSHHKGTFVISDGKIEFDFLVPGQYFRIVDSTFNDGVYLYPVAGLTDEKFTGEIWALSVPKAVVKIFDEIKEWQIDNKPSQFISESFGGYSRTSAVNSSTGSPQTWQDVFRTRLNPWRKL